MAEKTILSTLLPEAGMTVDSLQRLDENVEEIKPYVPWITAGLWAIAVMIAVVILKK